MTMYEIGAEVFWNDPDEACSRYGIITKILHKSSDGNTIYILDNETEVFEHECE